MEKASPVVDVLPPPDPAAALRLGVVGVVLVLVGAAVGLAADSLADPGAGPVGTARLLLTAAGVLLAGCAVSRRPDRPLVWLTLAAAAAAAIAAVPPHWDSARLLAKFVAAVAGSFALVNATPPAWRPAAMTAGVVFHFLGILAATTWPTATPWITQQAMMRVFAPYLRAVYLSNAYHFYSPEPGPASLLHMLVRYELDEVDPATGKPRTASEWVVFPKRELHMKDPLGLSYYRRLSLTEAAAATLADAQTADTFNRNEAHQARAAVAMTGFPRTTPDGKTEQVVIPLPPNEFEPSQTQYRVPDSLVSRNLLPSYARHLAVALSAPGQKVVNVKMYRLEHRVVPPEAFVGTSRQPRIDPFHPTTYRAYFLGDYDATGHLTNPRDPLLYWLIPVLPKAAAPTDKDRVDYDDYLSRHAGFEVDWRRP